MNDEVVTHAEVLRWLPSHIRRDLEMAMPPEQRGWFTETEVQEYDGRFVEVRKLSEAEPRFWATGRVTRRCFLPTITNLAAPTGAEIGQQERRG